MTKFLNPRYKKNKSHLVRGFFSSNTTSEENTKWKETAPGVVFLLSPCFGTKFFLLIWRLLLVYQAEVEGNCLFEFKRDLFDLNLLYDNDIFEQCEEDEDDADAHPDVKG